jgi:subtilisin family serine protease
MISTNTYKGVVKLKKILSIVLISTLMLHCVITYWAPTLDFSKAFATGEFSEETFVEVSDEVQKKREKPYSKKELLVRFKDMKKLKLAKKKLKTKLKIKKLSIKKAFEKNKVGLLEFEHEKDRIRIMKELKKDSNIESIQPNYRMFSMSSPSDSHFHTQWGLDNQGQEVNLKHGKASIDISALKAWDISENNHEVIVGILDTGVDILHPELKNNIATNVSEIPNNGKDDDQNGYIDDVHGYDFYHQDASVFDDEEHDKHGTHIAGIIASNQGSGQVVGVSPNVKVLPLKFIHDDFGYTSDAIEAIEYAKSMGVQVVNCSFGNYHDNPLLKEAMESSGILFVCASGNESSHTSVSPTYPAHFDLDNIISVASIGNSGRLSYFSNFGDSVDIAAPGEDIYSTLPEGKYGFLSGTSMSSAFTSGVASLLLSQKGSMTHKEIKDTLLQHVVQKSILSEKVNTNGLLNAYLALGGERNESFLQNEKIEMGTPFVVDPAMLVAEENEIDDPFHDEVTDHRMSTLSATYPLNYGLSYESFEDGFIEWTNDANDDLDWIRHTGVTQSAGTGPSKTQYGSYYAYVEASYENHPQKTAYLNGPLVFEEDVVIFSYHMYGVSMGSLELQGFNGTEWVNLWAKEGDQTFTWYHEAVTIPKGIHYVRFAATTGADYLSDIVIDNISIVNHNESFEHGFRSWNNVAGDDLNFTLHSDATPSSNTGPSLAYHGENYVYLEASSPNNPSKSAYLEGPPVIEGTNISFEYHMYGENMGSLSLQGYDGLTWVDLWSQHSAQYDQWQSETVTIPPDISKVRFYAVTGNGAYSDIAIDNIQIMIPSESFEFGQKKWRNEHNSELQWLPYIGSTFSSGTGPTFSSDGRTYLYLEASTTQHGDRDAYFIGPKVNYRDTITFDYHMYGATMGTLTLQGFDGESWVDVWSISGDQGDLWHTHSLDIDPGIRQVRFKGDVGTNYQSDIGLDRIQIDSIHETFETGFTSWSNDLTDDLNWQKKSRTTHSSETGPNSSFMGEYYAYIEGSGNNFPSKKAILNGPDVVEGEEVTFYYNMNVSSEAKLTLQGFNGSTWVELWKEEGNKGQNWLKGSSIIPSDVTQIRFIGETGNDHKGDIGLDQINIINPKLKYQTQPVDIVLNVADDTIQMDDFEEVMEDELKARLTDLGIDYQIHVKESVQYHPVTHIRSYGGSYYAIANEKLYIWGSANGSNKPMYVLDGVKDVKVGTVGTLIHKTDNSVYSMEFPSQSLTLVQNNVEKIYMPYSDEEYNSSGVIQNDLCYFVTKVSGHTNTYTVYEPFGDFSIQKYVQSNIPTALGEKVFVSDNRINPFHQWKNFDRKMLDGQLQTDGMQFIDVIPVIVDYPTSEYVGERYYLISNHIVYIDQHYDIRYTPTPHYYQEEIFDNSYYSSDSYRYRKVYKLSGSTYQYSYYHPNYGSFLGVNNVEKVNSDAISATSHFILNDGSLAVKYFFSDTSKEIFENTAEEQTLGNYTGTLFHYPRKIFGSYETPLSESIQDLGSLRPHAKKVFVDVRKPMATDLESQNMTSTQNQIIQYGADFIGLGSDENIHAYQNLLSSENISGIALQNTHVRNSIQEVAEYVIKHTRIDEHQEVVEPEYGENIEYIYDVNGRLSEFKIDGVLKKSFIYDDNGNCIQVITN